MPDAFLKLTIREANWKIEAYNDQIERENRNLEWLAYHTALDTVLLKQTQEGHHFASMEDLHPSVQKDPRDEHRNAIEIAKKLGDPVPD